MPRVEPVPVDHLTPHARQMLEEGKASGVYNNNTGEIPPSMRTLAYSTQALETAHASAMASWKPGLLGMRLKELIRIRSAQVNGCANCAGAIKDDGVSEGDVACMVDTDFSAFTPREAAALRYVTMFATDHHSIGDGEVTSLLQEFTPAEIVELIHYAATQGGAHRMFHVFQVISDCDPVIRFAPGLVDAPTVEAGDCAA